MSSSTRPLDSLHDRLLEEVNQAIDVLTLGENEAITRPGPRPKRPTYARVVIAYDGSPGAQAALAQGQRIAQAHGSRVYVASVFASPEVSSPTAMGFGWYPSYVGEYARIQEDTRKAADAAVAQLRAAKLTVEPIVREGSAARDLSTIAATHKADLVITGSNRRGAMGRFFLGTTSSAVLDRAHCSVMIARGSAPFRRILVATDGSHPSYRAVAHALTLASELGAELIVQHVISFPEGRDDVPTDGFLQAVMKQIELPAAPPRVRYVLDAGDPASRILARAQSDACDLIVLGSHGKGALERALIGSVSRHVAREADASVLVVKEPAHGR